ncbi:MAG: hypothetical protein IJE77_12840 [Thermoguttaceae bacterium]|nr:hypothetical protein [Thermoguttaceae bacterium]
MIADQRVKAFMDRIADAIFEHNPKRVCVFKSGTYDVEVVMDGPDSALFASCFPDYELTHPTLEELAELPTSCVKYVGDAEDYFDNKSLRINRNRGTGTLIVVLHTDWRRDLLGVDYVDEKYADPQKLFAAKLNGLTVYVDRGLRKEHLSFLLDASGGLPETGWWIARGNETEFWVYWRDPEDRLHERIFSFDTFFEEYPDEEPEEIDYYE